MRKSKDIPPEMDFKHMLVRGAASGAADAYSMERSDGITTMN
jgi:hypothetical protein